MQHVKFIPEPVFNCFFHSIAVTKHLLHQDLLGNQVSLFLKSLIPNLWCGSVTILDNNSQKQQVSTLARSSWPSIIFPHLKNLQKNPHPISSVHESHDGNQTKELINLQCQQTSSHINIKQIYNPVVHQKCASGSQGERAEHGEGSGVSKQGPLLVVPTPKSHDQLSAAAAQLRDYRGIKTLSIPL